MTVTPDRSRGTPQLFDYEAELRLYNEHFRAAARVGPAAGEPRGRGAEGQSPAPPKGGKGDRPYDRTR